MVGELPAKPSSAPPACPLCLWKLRLVSVFPKINPGQLEEVSQSIHQRRGQRAVIQEAKFRLWAPAGQRLGTRRGLPLAATLRTRCSEQPAGWGAPGLQGGTVLAAGS